MKLALFLKFFTAGITVYNVPNHTCRKEKFESTSKPTKDLTILGKNAVIGDCFQIIWQCRF